MLLVTAASSGGAQGAATIPVSSDIYRRLEAVSAFFPAAVHLGLRPASVRALRAAIGRVERAASAAPADHPRRQWALHELSRLRQSLDPDSSGGSPFRTAWHAQAEASNARTDRIQPNGLGLLDAVENPFADASQGRTVPQGIAFRGALTGGYAARRFMLLAEPAIEVVGDTGLGSLDLRMRRAYGRLVLRNAAFQIGSDGRFWGQSPHGALFLSQHAAPIPAIALGTDTAITLPWLFGLAGPVQGAMFLADLGPTQDPPHARLVGWQLSTQPWSRFEIGVAVLVHTGGNGAPPATFLERVIDLFPIIDALAPQHADLQFSNKIAGGNLRLRFPELSGLDVYYELAIDDFDGRRLASSLFEDSGHLLGGRIAAGPVVLRGEWHATSVRLYEHAQFRSGLAYRERLLGNPLGPNAVGAYLGAEWDLSPSTHLTLSMSDESRDPSQYVARVTGERDRGFSFVRVTDEPEVRRTTATVAMDRSGTVGGLTLAAGYNRGWRTGGRSRHEWLVRAGFRSQSLPVF